MPRITAPTVAEHREQRRAELLAAAAVLIQRRGPFTVAEVAAEVGISRSAVYEYCDSAADLIADVLVDELADWADDLTLALAGLTDPRERVDAWVRAVLTYVSEGRHALVRAAGTIDLPPTRKAEVQARHRDLVNPLHAALSELDVDDAGRLAAHLWGVVDAAITRIETSGAEPVAAGEETDAVLDFIHGGIDRVIADPS